LLWLLRYSLFHGSVHLTLTVAKVEDARDPRRPRVRL
jgi:hypothetical protein